jgi:hypothetical protein
VFVRSVNTSRSTDAGSELRRLGSSFCTSSTTPIMFAPGCRWMLTMIAGFSTTPWAGVAEPSAAVPAGRADVPIHAAWYRFSALSTASAMSESRTGLPLRYAMITLL